MREDSRFFGHCDRPSQVVQPNWLTTAQAGRRLGVDPTVVIKWVKVGRLRGRRDTDRWRVDPAIATGPFVTVSNDIIGMAIYLTLASAYLRTH